MEIDALTKQRDEILPLLMNGQVSLNSDLFNKDIEINSLYSSELILILITDATHLIIMVPLVVMAFLRLTHS